MKSRFIIRWGEIKKNRCIIAVNNKLRNEMGSYI